MPPAAATLAGLVALALDGARLPALVVTDGDLAQAQVPVSDDVLVLRAGDARPDAHLRTVLLVAADADGLRRAAARVGDLGGTRMVGVVVGQADGAVPLRAHPSWPPLSDVHARTVDGGAVTRVDFAARLRATPVLTALARGTAPPVPAGHGGLRVATRQERYDVDDTVPPDVLLGGASDLAPAASPVTGRAPLLVTDLDEPLDEALFNPVGFKREWTRGMVELPGTTTLTPALVRDLRDAQGVTLPAGAADPRLTAGLAMAGIPTVAIDDPLDRERHSVRTRREALLRHSTFAWRARLAERAGVHLVEPPPADDLDLARRYTGADLVVVPEDDDGPTECFVAEPPPGRVRHDPGRTPGQIVAAGGVVYVTHGAVVG